MQAEQALLHSVSLPASSEKRAMKVTIISSLNLTSRAPVERVRLSAGAKPVK
jgi:hypothetical protein